MKKANLLSLPLLVASIFFSLSAMSQCGDLVFTTQSEVNAFSCTGAVTSMTFQDASGTLDPITNLVPIWSQGTGVSVIGDLIVNNCDELTTLDGLDRIQSVGGNFLVYQNAGLIEINDPSWSFLMTSIAGTLEVSNNPLLAMYADLDQLTTLGKFICSGNTAMTVLGGFSSLTSIGDNVLITSNANLTTVNAFPLISNVVGSIFVTGNSSLSNCCNSIYDLYVAAGSLTSQVNSNAPGCNTISEIDDPKSYLLKTQSDVDNFRPCAFGVVDLIIDGDGVTEDPIVNLTPIYFQGGPDFAISGDLIIRNCSDLTTLDGLDRIVSVGGDFKVESNPSLTEINHPDWPFQLTSIGAQLRIENNTILASHSDLNSLETVGGFIRYYTNTSLVTLAGFEGLTTAGHIDIGFNDALESLPAFSLLSSAGFIGIRSNASLAAINTFPVLESAERVRIAHNTNLLTIDGFNNLLILETEDFRLVRLLIDNNGQLHTISGFNSLASINGHPDFEEDSFEISNNSSLSIVTAFGSLSVVQGPTVVIDNASLGTCCWLAPIIAGTTGSVELMNNASGCNTVAEVNAPQNYLLRNQTEVDNFSLCDLGVVDLIIDGSTEGTDPIINLNPIFFAGLTELSGDLIVRNCNELLRLEGLDGIIDVGGSFIIQDNVVLAEINSSGFPFQLSSVGGDIFIFNNALLQSHSDLNLLTTVGGGLRYVSNDILASIGGYSNLTQVAYLQLSSNNNLLQLPTFVTLSSCQRITITYNNSLATIPQFDGLISGLENIDIGFNDALTTIDGFNNLTAITGDKRLKIGQCANLQSITGFNSLQSISGFGWSIEPVLEIVSNPNLLTVSGFQNLTEVVAIDPDGGRAIEVAGNASLSTCCWLEPVIAGAVGDVVLVGNATGCNSEAEIDAACPDPIDCPGDFNGDLMVNISDFFSFNALFGESCASCLEDLNDDGIVGINDFILFNALFGNDCTNPEPPIVFLGGINAQLLAAIDRQATDTLDPELLKVIDEMRVDLEFKIVPNPNQGKEFELYIRDIDDQNEQLDIRLYDMTGRAVEVFRKTSSKGKIALRTEQDLSPGVYMVTLTLNAEVSTRRMTVE